MLVLDVLVRKKFLCLQCWIRRLRITKNQHKDMVEAYERGATMNLADLDKIVAENVEQEVEDSFNPGLGK